nr:hypothetical protein [Tanacetum cinerariifolium]
MRTRSQSRSRNNSPQREAIPAIVEPLHIELPFLEDQFQEDPPPESPMADNRTVAQLLQAPTEGYEEAIVIPEITANNFELKHESPIDTMADQRTMAELLRSPTEGYAEAIVVPSILAEQFKLKHSLINMMNSDQFFRQEKDNPRDHIRPLTRNTIANPKGELKAITTRSGIVFDGPFVPMPPSFINPKEDERVEETLTDQDLAEMHKQKQQEKDEVQIHKFWQMFKQLDINITLADALILIPKYKKMLKALLSNKENLLELVNTPLNENCSAVILKKLPEKLRDLGKFLILCGFSELKCKALADLAASINLMPLSVWKKLGLPELISTRMTFKLANRAICTPAGIARDVFVPVGKFIFPADFVIVDYESDPRVPLILGRPFLWTARSLIDVHREEMILLNDDIFDPEGGNVLIEKLLDLDSTKDLPPPYSVNPLSGSTTSSLNHLLEEFIDELALITFPPRNDDLPFDIESDLKEIEYLLNHDLIKEMDSILKESINEDNLADLNDNLVDTMPEMFIDKHALDYSPPLLYDEYDDDLFEVESETEYVYFISKEDEIKESKLLIDELDSLRSSDFLPSLEYDSFLFEDFSKVDAFPLTHKEDKKIAISHASLILEDFDPPISLYELPFHKEVPWPETLLSFLSKNEEKVFKLRILTSKGVYASLLPKLSYRGTKAFKVIKIIESSMEIFPCSFGEDIRILDVPCLHFYPP